MKYADMGLYIADVCSLFPSGNEYYLIGINRFYICVRRYVVLNKLLSSIFQYFPIKVFFHINTINVLLK